MTLPPEPLRWEDQDHGTNDLDVLNMLFNRHLCGKPSNEELVQQEQSLSLSITNAEKEIVSLQRKVSDLTRQRTILREVKRLSPTTESV